MKRRHSIGLKLASRLPGSSQTATFKPLFVTSVLQLKTHAKNPFGVCSHSIDFKQLVVPSHLRQKSEIKMNRRLNWSQSPPDFNDYSAECLQGPAALGPFQQIPLGLKLENPDTPESSTTATPPPCGNPGSKAKRGKTEPEGHALILCCHL